MIPNNADFSTGELIGKPKAPALPYDQYKPVVNSAVPGENYFESDTQTLWVTVRGGRPVEIRTTPVVMVSFGVPGVSMGDFYESGQLVENLAALLGVDQSQIRVVEVIREDGLRLRRRRLRFRRQSDDDAEVVVEIGPQPAQEIAPPHEGASTPAPTTRKHFDDPKTSPLHVQS